MREYRKPDLNAPRYRAKCLDILNKEFYNIFSLNTPAVLTNKRVCNQFNQTLSTSKTKTKFGFNGSDEAFLSSSELQNFVSKKIDLINSHLDHWEQIKKFQIGNCYLTRKETNNSCGLKMSITIKNLVIVNQCLYLNPPFL